MSVRPSIYPPDATDEPGDVGGDQAPAAVTDDVVAAEPETLSAAELAALRASEHARRLRRERLLSVLSPLLLLGVWELLARNEVLDRRFFPPPSEIMGTFVELVRSGELISHLRITLTRMIIGLLIGGIPGLTIGVLMGLSRNFRAFTKPIIAALFPIPKIAVLPLILLIFGLGEASKYASVAIGVVFVIIINSCAAVMQIDDIYLDVGRNFGASKWQFFHRIAIPGAMPGLLTGLQLALTVSLLIAIASEFVAARSGIGYLIWHSWTIFDVNTMYVGLTVCALLGLLFQATLDLLHRVLVPWRRRDHR